MKCKLSGYEVNVFNGSILVSEQFGRSLTSRDAYLISPDEKFYNFRSFAEITSVTPSLGSDQGGTYLSINGSFFFHEESFPAVIEVGGNGDFNKLKKKKNLKKFNSLLFKELLVRWLALMETTN